MKHYFVFIAFFFWYRESLSQSVDSSTLSQHIDSLIKESKNLRDRGDYNASYQLTVEAERMAIENFGVKSESYAASRLNHGKWFLAKSDYAAAEKCYQESLEIFKELFGIMHTQYGKALGSLGVLYYWKGRYEDCEKIYLQVKDIQEHALGKNHVDYAAIINNLALLYKETGRYDKAEPYYLESYQIIKTNLGSRHAQFAQSANNLGVFFFTMGNYRKAEQFYIEAKEIRELVLGKTHPDYATSLNNLATLYSTLGNHNKSVVYHEEVKTIFENLKGEKLRYAQSLYNLASEYSFNKNFEPAKELLVNARNILSTEFGKNHIDYVNSTMLLSSVFNQMKNFEMADSLLLEAKSRQEMITGKNHAHYARILATQGRYNLERAKIKDATELLEEAVTTMERTMGEYYSEYPSALMSLAFSKERSNHFSAADSLLKVCCELDQKKLLQTVQYLSSEELNLHSDAIYKNLSNLWSVLYRRNLSAAGSEKLINAIFDENLFHKGFVLSSASKVNVYANQNSDTKESNQMLLALKRKINRMNTLPIQARNQDALNELIENANTLEKKLVQEISEYGEAIRQVHYNDIISSLKNGEAAIDFISFKLGFPVLTDSIVYAALLVRPFDETAQLIPLFEENELSSILNAGYSRPSDVYATRGAHEVRMSNQTSLYNLIWKKIDPFLKDIQKVYYVPTGALYRINFDALQWKEKVLLSDHYDLVQLSSLRKLVFDDTIQSEPKTSILFGGIDYDANQYSGEDGKVKNLELGLSKIEDRVVPFVNKPGIWRYLEGTEIETDSVASILRFNGCKVSLYKSQDATEEVFKKIGVEDLSPTILHFATHGFFAPDPGHLPYRNSDSVFMKIEGESTFTTSSLPMFRSGLLLAGGNSGWEGNVPVTREEDGVLTAYEISQMNLSHTELVVLSACETGLGDIKGNEGVYGLQRAFKIAGVKYIIMSLWQIPDNQTSLLMTTFYKKWLQDHLSIPEAFHEAQQVLRHKSLDPFYWAGFVLVR
ncbi:MAG: CHAT domain-containing tetratricopeptide repeat protein [Saprospiraceae bacterium]